MNALGLPLDELVTDEVLNEAIKSLGGGGERA